MLHDDVSDGENGTAGRADQQSFWACEHCSGDGTGSGERAEFDVVHWIGSCAAHSAFLINIEVTRISGIDDSGGESELLAAGHANAKRFDGQRGLTCKAACSMRALELAIHAGSGRNDNLAIDLDRFRE